MPRPTLNDIARSLGFSKNTISLALRGDPQIPEVTRERIRKAADRLGYQPNAVVSHLMAQLRASRTTRLQAKLALVNANRDPDAFRNHPTIPTYVEGCESRAARLGYSFDRFWLHDPTLNASRWLRIMHTRGIKGLVLVGLMDSHHLPDEMRPVWEQLPTVVTGVRTRDPALSFASVDHHNLALMAVERALALGYRRPGLVLDDVIDALVERRFSAGYLAGRRSLPRAQHIPIFSDLSHAEKEPKYFRTWLDKYRPDVVFTLYNNVLAWLKAAGRGVPEDIGVIQLEWRAARPEIAGMNQHNLVTGEAAVDMIVSQIHNNETGVQEFPRATLIGATWVLGSTVREQARSDTGIPAGGPEGTQTGMSVPPLSVTHVSRRNLPHWRAEGAVYWVTFRLADSLPKAKLTQLRAEKEAWLRANPEPWTLDQQRDRQARFGERVQDWLDAGYGSCALARPGIRDVVRECLIRFDGDRLRLHAAVIMPNHVHALIEPLSGAAQGGVQKGMSVPRETGISAGGPAAQTRMSVPREIGIPAGDATAQTGMSVSLSRLLKGIKGASARAANRLLGQTGAFWMDESYDRIVRDSDEYRAFVEYIRANPVKAGLRELQYWLHCPMA